MRYVLRQANCCRRAVGVFISRRLSIFYKRLKHDTNKDRPFIYNLLGNRKRMENEN